MLTVTALVNTIANTLTSEGIKLAKTMRSFRIDESVIQKLQEIGDQEFNGNVTAALEDMINHSHLVRSIPEGDRDRLRVSAKRGAYSAEYDKHERKMIDFFLV